MRSLLLIPLLFLAGCPGSSPRPADLGGPNAGLSEARLAAFERGKAIFLKRFTRTEGHGPDFNTSSCMSCHEIPVAGGSSPLYRNFFLARKDGQNYFDDDQLVARTFSYTRMMRERIGDDADVVAQRNAPPMFGVGDFERITDSEILANQDPFDNNPADGISGKANFDFTEVGRFGYKAQEAGLEDFIRGPIFNHMGITTNPLSFGAQITGNLSAIAQASAPEDPTTDEDGVDDPELGFQDLSDLLVFCEELARPRPLPMDSDAIRGEELFSEVRCDLCHIPSLNQTGAPILAYTDLLVHDMGGDPDDDIVMGLAQGNEFRTAPLWGLRHHAPFLHDGRADTIEVAIEAHRGEGNDARGRFFGLSPDDRAKLIKFLETR